MGALQLIGELRGLGVNLTASNGKINLDAPAGLLTPELKAEIRRQGKAVGELLQIEADYLALCDNILSKVDLAEECGASGDQEGREAAIAEVNRILEGEWDTAWRGYVAAMEAS